MCYIKKTKCKDFNIGNIQAYNFIFNDIQHMNFSFVRFIEDLEWEDLRHGSGQT